MSKHHKSCKWENYIAMEFLPCPFCRIEELTERNAELQAENYDIKEYLQQVEDKYRDMEKDGTDDCCAFCIPANKLKQELSRYRTGVEVEGHTLHRNIELAASLPEELTLQNVAVLVMKKR